MTSKTQDEQNNQQFLTLLTQFYCGLTVRKDMQHIACEIRQFVMMRKDIKRKQIVAKNLLDYFLKLQSKLVNKSDIQWDHAFQISTARGRALLKICNFPIRNNLQFAFNQLKSPQNPISPSSVNFYSKTVTQVSQYDHIQVQQDVKMKTRYFFRWCQYVLHAKAFKQLKMREVQNQKISLNFNKYGLKFNYFNAWKKLYKKYKSQRQKVKQIQTRCNYNILRKSISSIQQIAAIIGFQTQLASKVSSKIVGFQKRLIYKKLKINNENIKKASKLRRTNNSMYYIFMKYLTSKVKPLMNRSYIQSRKQFVENERNMILNDVFKGIQCQFRQTVHKINLIKDKIRNNYLLRWNNQHQSDCNNKKCELQTNRYLIQRRKKVVITILSFNKMVKTDQFSKIQHMIQQSNHSLPNMKITQANNRKISGDKIALLSSFLLLGKYQNSVRKIKDNNKLMQKKQNIEKFKRKFLFNTLLSRYKSYKTKLLIKKNEYNELMNRYLTNLCYTSFRKWRKLKFYHRVEQQILNSYDKTCKKIAMRQFWNKFKYRLKQKQSFTKFENAINTAFIKLTFIKIMGRSCFINERVKKIRQLKNSKLMKKLFEMLQQNVQYNAKISTQIQNLYAKRCQHTLIKNLKIILKNKQKIEKIQRRLQLNKVKVFLNKIKEEKQLSKDLKEKSDFVSKIMFLKYFKKCVKQSIRINQINILKIQQTEVKLRQILASRLIHRLKRNQQQLKNQLEKQNKIIFKKIRFYVVKLKQYIETKKNYNRIQKNQIIIKNKRINNSIKLLALKSKSKRIENANRLNRCILGFSDLKILIIKKSSIEHSSQNLNNFLMSKHYKTFSKCIEAQKKQFDDKTNKVQELTEQSKKQNLKIALNLLKNNKENIQNFRALEENKKTKLFTQFIAMSLSSKFSRIKFNCSLKTYAKNLLKKGFKSLKQSHLKIKQKENMIKLDKTSSIMIQKSIQKSFKSNTLSEQIQRFNLRKSRQIR